MQSEKKPLQIIASSALASSISTFLTNPIDVVKTRLQRDAMECRDLTIHERKFGKAPLSLRNIQPEAVKPAHLPCRCIPYNSTLKVMLHIAKNEGVMTLSNGLKSSILIAVSSHTSFMFLYENVKKWISKVTEHPVLLPLSSSLTTRIAVTSILFPLDYFRTMQQSASGVSKIGLKEIRLNLKAGYGPLIARDLLFSGVYWVSIENIRSAIMSRLRENNFLERGQKILLANAISGALSGCIAATLTLPLDVVKTRLQINESLRAIPGRRLLLDIYKNEGLPALFTGLRQRLLKVGLTCGGVLALYEYFNHVFQSYMWLE